MSIKPVAISVPQPEPAKEIPKLTQAYRDARAGFIFTAVLLASWELIGISVDAKPNLGFEIETAVKPQALILFIFLILIGCIMNSTWMRCDPESRKHAVPNRTPRTAHRIAMIAVAIAIIQYLLHNQIVAYVTRHQRQAFAVAALLVLIPTVGLLGEVLHVGFTAPKLLKWMLITVILMTVSYGSQAVVHRSYSFVFAAFPWAICALILSRSRWNTEATQS